MNMKALLLASALGASVAGAAAANLDAAAADACACLKEPYSKADQLVGLMMQAQATGDMSPVMAMQQDMMNLANATAQCFDTLSKKYPDIAASDELKQQVVAITDQQCPNPIKRYMSALGQMMPPGGPVPR